MNRLAILSFAAVIFAAGAANAVEPAAGTGEQSARFEGHVNGACRMGAPTAVSTDNVTVGALSTGSAEFTIDQLVGPDGIPLAAQVVVNIPAICTQAHVLSVSSLNDGLSTPQPVAPGSPFRNVLDYSVNVLWAGQSNDFTASGSDLAAPIPDAAQGDVTVTISLPGGGDPAVAGIYSDEIILQLGVAG